MAEGIRPAVSLFGMMHLPCPAPNDSRPGRKRLPSSRRGRTRASVLGCSHKDVRAWLVSPVSRRDTCHGTEHSRRGQQRVLRGRRRPVNLSVNHASGRESSLSDRRGPRGGEAPGKRLKPSSLAHPSGWRMVRTWCAVNIAWPRWVMSPAPRTAHHINRQHISALHPGRPGP